MFTDASGRFVTAGQWHDEKFYAFMAPPEIQAQAPSYLLLGGMDEAKVPMPEVLEKGMDSTQKTEVAVY